MNPAPPFTRFIFEDAVEADDIRDTLDVALTAIRGTHGEAAVALEAHHQFDPDNLEVRIATGAPAGRDLARAIYELASGSLGCGSFRVLCNWSAW